MDEVLVMLKMFPGNSRFFCNIRMSLQDTDSSEGPATELTHACHYYYYFQLCYVTTTVSPLLSSRTIPHVSCLACFPSTPPLSPLRKGLVSPGMNKA